MRALLLGLVFSGMLAGSAGAGAAVALLLPSSAAAGPVVAEAVQVEADPVARDRRVGSVARDRPEKAGKGKAGAKPGKQKKPSTPQPKPKPAPDPEPAPPAPDSGIVYLGGNRYQVPRALIERYVSDPNALAGQAGASQVAAGWKLTSVKSGSKVAQMGLKQGDVVTSVNGYGLDSLSKTWWAAAHLKNEESYRVAIKRAGTPQTLRYDVID